MMYMYTHECIMCSFTSGNELTCDCVFVFNFCYLFFNFNFISITSLYMYIQLQVCIHSYKMQYMIIRNVLYVYTCTCNIFYMVKGLGHCVGMRLMYHNKLLYL